MISVAQASMIGCYNYQALGSRILVNALENNYQNGLLIFS